MTSYILERLKELTAVDSPSGFTEKAAEYIFSEVEKLGFSPYYTNKGCVCTSIGGEGDPLVLSAHIDTLGGMVCEIKQDGRLRITNIGGLEANNVEAECCRVYTRSGKTYSGTMQLNDASVHVNGEYSKTSRSFDKTEILLDEKVFSQEDTAKLGISAGDFVCFDPRTVVTESGYIKSRFLDDKLSAAILLGVAKAVSENNIKLSRRVYLLFTVYEEVGHGAAAGLPTDTKEIVSVDMGCVGNGLGCNEQMVSICAKDSFGPYDYSVTTRLIELAKEHKLNYAVDVYPHYSSDADVSVSAGYDIKHGLIGAGVYASHGYERSHTDGVENTFKLICAYISK